MPALPSSSRRTSVRLATKWEDGCRGVILPWLQAQAAEAWRHREPTVVLVPTRAYGFYLHSRVVEAGFALAAIHFWTPRDARANLLKTLPGILPTPSQEILHVLAALAANQVAKKDPLNRSAAAVLAEPDSFLQTIDQLAGAGWDLAEIADPPLRAVVRQWRALLKEEGFQTVQEMDAAMATATTSGEPFLNAVLVCGFEGSRWADLPILRAVVKAARASEVLLTAPRLGWEEADQAWIGTWEQHFGEAQPVEASEGNEESWPFERLQSALHLHENRVAGATPEVEFALGEGIREEALAIRRTALQFLQDENCTRLGIVFPGHCALAREVSDLFRADGMACDDSFGFVVPGSFDREDWQVWLELQQAPGLARFLEFLRTFPNGAWQENSLETADSIAARLRSAFKEVLVDDLNVLRAWLAQTESQRDRATVSCLEQLAPLPEQATWADFLGRTIEQHRHLDWDERAERIEFCARETKFLREREVPRSVFLRWLVEVTRSIRKERHPDGNHRYSRIHLLSYGEAEKQRWSHLILTSLSEGVWPPTTSQIGFLSGNEVLRLNRRVRQLNAGVLEEGGQGEGHVRVKEGQGYCLGPFERRLLAQSQTLGLLETVSVQLALTARLSEKAGGQELTPNEFFGGIYALSTSRILNETEIERITYKPEENEERSEPVPDEDDPITTVRVAYEARRNPEIGFGEFEFALKKPQARPVTLSCGEWESALKAPAAVWMKKYLGVSTEEACDAESFLLPVRGTWAHKWLANLGAPRSNRFVPWPSTVELTAGLDKSAQEQRRKVEQLLAENGWALPVWWISLWQEARFQARELLAMLSSAREWPAFSTEYSVPQTECDFASGNLPPLKLDGRIDLLLAWSPPERDDLLPAELWVIDFKTGGATKPLSLGDLSKGNGVQLALYALALRQRGATRVQASLLKPGEPLQEQIGIDLIISLSEGWEELQRMQATGVFGMHGEVRSEYGRTLLYPLSTLVVDSEILRRKWKRAHPAWTEVAA